MTCVSPCNREYWHDKAAGWDDETVLSKLKWAQSYYEDKEKGGRGFGPPYSRSHHDWVMVRALLIREARKRGLI